jgi:hypothetical protein
MPLTIASDLWHLFPDGSSDSEGILCWLSCYISHTDISYDRYGQFHSLISNDLILVIMQVLRGNRNRWSSGNTLDLYSTLGFPQSFHAVSRIMLQLCHDHFLPNVLPFVPNNNINGGRVVRQWTLELHGHSLRLSASAQLKYKGHTDFILYTQLGTPSMYMMEEKCQNLRGTNQNFVYCKLLHTKP